MGDEEYGGNVMLEVGTTLEACERRKRWQSRPESAGEAPG
jgi:hypothetical protein